jgi:hypothetical protein
MRYFKYLPGGFIVETPDMNVARVVKIYDNYLSPYYEPQLAYSDGWIKLGSKDDGWEEVSRYGLKAANTTYSRNDDMARDFTYDIRMDSVETIKDSVFNEFITEDSSDFEPQDFQSSVLAITHDIALMLIDKNKKYGNSALEPIRIFSKSDSIEQINVRIDDKLSRIKNASELEDEDVISDLIGYLVLLKLKRSESVCTTKTQI